MNIIAMTIIVRLHNRYSNDITVINRIKFHKNNSNRKGFDTQRNKNALETISVCKTCAENKNNQPKPKITDSDKKLCIKLVISGHTYI